MKNSKEIQIFIYFFIILSFFKFVFIIFLSFLLILIYHFCDLNLDIYFSVTAPSASFRQQPAITERDETCDGAVSGAHDRKTLRPNILSTPKLTISPSQSALDLAKKAKEHAAGGAERKKPAAAAVAAIKPRGGFQAQQSESAEQFLQLVRDEGLFEAARLATPLLPQYHPRQLMELLNAGKTKRVKAILLHILRYVRDKSQMWADVVNPATRKASTMSMSTDDEGGGRWA